MPRRLVALGLAVAAALAVAGPASASLSDELRAGQTLVRQLRAGNTSCGQLATRDFEHVGEYVMGRMAGSVRLHEAMNQRMRSVMGARSEERMHVLMGQRYSGCAATGGVGRMMGTGMMRPARRGWRARDYLLTGVAVVLVAGFAGALLAWRPWRTRSQAP